MGWAVMTTDSNTNAARETDLEGKCALIRAAYAADMAELVDRITRGESIVDPTFRMPTRLQAVVRDLTAQSPASAPEQASVGADAEICEIVKQCAAALTDLRNDDQQRSVKSAIGRICCIEAGANRLLAALSPRPSDVREQQVEQGDGGTSERITVNPCDPTENPVILPGDKIRDRRDTTGTLWRVLARIDAGLSNMIKLGKVDGDEVRWVPSREIVGHCDLVVPYGVPAPGEIVGSPSAALTQPPRQSEDGRMRTIEKIESTLKAVKDIPVGYGLTNKQVVDRAVVMDSVTEALVAIAALRADSATD
jgi:hypothetical protein